MFEVAYHELARKEDDFWWSESRRRLIRLFLRKVSLPDDATALDVGCGTGGSLGLLSEYAGQVVGFDLHPLAIDLARRKHPAAEFRLGDANRLGEHVDARTFDLVAILGVLYHQWISDDLAVLRQTRAVLKPGGVLLLTEPAFPCLSRRHDRLVMARQRYTLKGMRALLEEAGFEWITGTYFNMLSFLPAWLLAQRDRLRPARGPDELAGEVAPSSRLLNTGMKALETIERTAIRLFGRLPFGVELLALARVPGGSVAHREEANRQDAQSVKQTKMGALLAARSG